MLDSDCDAVVMTGFRNAMAQAAASAVDPGWELVGGPYCGSIFPRMGTPQDSTIGIPVSRDERRVALYRIDEETSAIYLGLESLSGEASEHSDAATQTEAVKPPAALPVRRINSLTELCAFCLRVVFGAVALCGRGCAEWLEQRAARPTEKSRNRP